NEVSVRHLPRGSLRQHASHRRLACGHGPFDFPHRLQPNVPRDDGGCFSGIGGLVAWHCLARIVGTPGIALRYAGAMGPLDFALHFQTYSLVALAAVVAWPFLYFGLHLEGFQGGWHFPAILSKLIVAVSLLLVVVLAFAFLTRHSYSRLVLLCFAILFLLGLVGVRCLACFLVASQLRNTADHRCVILGHGPIARELASKIASHPE